ncbi:hypothetical protein CJJ23_02445 [Mycoplasmopsis agassizii]|uniref:Uncharacterized protein n=1 Tax=Mycoplasmopsis agassizii TaxID=33922 RepID=A0A269TJ12_9BACT|nr:hypothetical protein [Mycoplasmopsis agassizii]PAK21377.1 hypothetical protein CJJ23_02445 [Mycoplasmopsis agassizii]
MKKKILIIATTVAATLAVGAGAATAAVVTLNRQEQKQISNPILIGGSNQPANPIKPIEKPAEGLILIDKSGQAQSEVSSSDFLNTYKSNLEAQDFKFQNSSFTINEFISYLEKVSLSNSKINLIKSFNTEFNEYLNSQSAEIEFEILSLEKIEKNQLKINLELILNNEKVSSHILLSGFHVNENVEVTDNGNSENSGETESGIVFEKEIDPEESKQAEVINKTNELFSELNTLYANKLISLADKNKGAPEIYEQFNRLSNISEKISLLNTFFSFAKLDASIVKTFEVFPPEKFSRSLGFELFLSQNDQVTVLKFAFTDLVSLADEFENNWKEFHDYFALNHLQTDGSTTAYLFNEKVKNMDTSAFLNEVSKIQTVSEINQAILEKINHVFDSKYESKKILSWEYQYPENNLAPGSFLINLTVEFNEINYQVSVVVDGFLTDADYQVKVSRDKQKALEEENQKVQDSAKTKLEQDKKDFEDAKVLLKSNLVFKTTSDSQTYYKKLSALKPQQVINEIANQVQNEKVKENLQKATVTYAVVKFNITAKTEAEIVTVKVSLKYGENVLETTLKLQTNLKVEDASGVTFTLDNANAEFLLDMAYQNRFSANNFKKYLNDLNNVAPTWWTKFNQADFKEIKLLPLTHTTKDTLVLRVKLKNGTSFDVNIKAGIASENSLVQFQALISLYYKIITALESNWVAAYPNTQALNSWQPLRKINNKDVNEMQKRLFFFKNKLSKKELNGDTVQSLFMSKFVDNVIFYSAGQFEQHERINIALMLYRIDEKGNKKEWKYIARKLYSAKPNFNVGPFEYMLRLGLVRQ